MNRVEGKVAIITGGARGLGRATCLLLAQEGAIVAVADILDSEGLAVVSEIKQKGGQAQFSHMDVTKEDEITRVFAGIFNDFKRIDILVNNAGITGAVKPTHELTQADWDQVINIDARGVFFCTKHVIPYMKKGGKGSIINLSSIYGMVGGIDDPPPYIYHAAKGAVRMMTKSDAICYARDKIRVNSVHPGWIFTPLLEEVGLRFGNPEEFNKQLQKHIPLGHFGEPNDVAYGVLYLASDESKFVTGSELVIDGGYIAW
jgi:NAD(P)-dependent dehydrogenase (short-subunit alcohol dehydrogenase family)